jgi:23S rRNA (cytosine1962-C5)-methyltransferase
MMLPRIVLQPRRARPFYGRHPWVYAGAISAVEGDPPDGAEVDVVTHTGNFVARGLFNSKSKIRVRLYSWSEETFLDREFFRNTLAAAFHLRGPILGLDGAGQACRLVFSEGDGLSGCTIDRYDRWLVLQFGSLGLSQRKEMIVELLVELLRPAGIVLRTERGIRELEGLEARDGLLWGEAPPGPITIEENGVRFLVNLLEGQKTGFYLDQRDNRRAVARLAAGRTVLDAFCYTGGFGLAALHAGALSVQGVDVSEPALALARENARINNLQPIEFIRADVFDHLDALVAADAKFDLIVLDPPRFARARSAVDEAIRGYRRLHAKAIRLLQPNGILVGCCCSGLIEMGMFTEMLSQLAAEEKRFIQILQRRGQAPDHPVAATCPESSYLKCVVSRVR